VVVLGGSMSSMFPTENTSSNVALAVEVVVVEGRSRVSVEGILGFRPLFRLLDSRPILAFSVLEGCGNSNAEREWNEGKEETIYKTKRVAEREGIEGGAQTRFVTVRFQIERNNGLSLITMTCRI
jgi:hypothetical protein